MNDLVAVPEEAGRVKRFARWSGGKLVSILTLRGLVSVPNACAAMGTMVTLALGGFLPWHLGYTIFDPMLAVTVVMTIAIIWTAVFAAANLSAFATVATAANRAVLSLSADYHPPVPQGDWQPRPKAAEVHLEISNLGPAHMADVEVLVWSMVDSGTAWKARSSRESDTLIRAGYAWSGKFLLPISSDSPQPDDPKEQEKIIVQVRYRDREEFVKNRAYGLRSPPAVSGRCKLLAKELQLPTFLQGRTFQLDDFVSRM